jgi:hypothetical protein
LYHFYHRNSLEKVQNILSDRIDRMGRIFFARPDAGPKESKPPATEGVFALSVRAEREIQEIP